MNSSVLCLFITIFFSLPRVWGISPQVFNIVANVTCKPEYAWMNNTESQSPCLAVAYVIAACAGDDWKQPALPDSNHSYNSPSGPTVTPCYCSWSCYNLLMACTLCQGPGFANDLTTWPTFFQKCPSNYDDKFPQRYVLANNASSIPYWATINPATWPSELFDITQAEIYANQSKYHSDYFPSALTSNSTSTSSSAGSGPNLGAIIGGTVGGVAGLLLVLIGGCFLYRRRKYRRLHYTSDGVTPILQTPTMRMSTHSRWPSDPSSIFPSTLMGGTTQLSGMSAVSPTPYSSYPATSPPPPTETESFFTTGNGVVQRTRPIPMV